MNLRGFCIAGSLPFALLAGSLSCNSPSQERTGATSASPHVEPEDEPLEGGARGSSSGSASIVDAGGTPPDPAWTASGDTVLADAAVASLSPIADAGAAGNLLPASPMPDALADAGSEPNEVLSIASPLPDVWTIEGLAVGQRAVCVLSGGIVFCAENVSTGPISRSSLLATYVNEPTVAAHQLTGGGDHFCARYDRAVSCWGENTFSQLGRGLLRTVVDLSSVAAGYLNTCIVTAAGEVWCWGDDAAGQLSVESRESPSILAGDSEPVWIELEAPASEAFVGGEHICALLEDGQLTCWGSNWFGEGGWEELPSEGTPLIDLGAGHVVVGAALGWHHSCAVLSDGSVKCWGQNNLGQLGLGDRVDRGTEVADMGAALPAVDLGGTAAKVALGWTHGCALLTDGNVKCWGGEADELLAEQPTLSIGDEPGEMGDALRPLDLGAGRVALDIVARSGTTCALLDDNSVTCWKGLPRADLDE